MTQRVVMTSAPRWTGAGTAASGRLAAIALAGEDIYTFTGRDTVGFIDSPLREQFGGPYTLTGIAQTHSMGGEERTFVHGNLTGRVDSIDLFHSGRREFFAMRRVQPLDPYFIDDGETFRIQRICDLAGADSGAYGNPSDEDSHLFLSVIACTNSDVCVGGVVDATFNDADTHWWPKSVGRNLQITIRNRSGARFRNECMPISSTGRFMLPVNYLAVGVPSNDEILIYRVGALHSGAVSSYRSPSSDYSVKDVVIEGRQEGSSLFGFVIALWTGRGVAKLEHLLATNGRIGRTPHLVEPIDANTTFIESRGGGVPGAKSELLYTFGETVVERTYAAD